MKDEKRRTALWHRERELACWETRLADHPKDPKLLAIVSKKRIERDDVFRALGLPAKGEERG